MLPSFRLHPVPRYRVKHDFGGTRRCASAARRPVYSKLGEPPGTSRAYLPASLGAAPTGFRALAHNTVVAIFSAFGGAGVARLGAGPAEMGRYRRIAAEYADARVADIGTVKA